MKKTLVAALVIAALIVGSFVWAYQESRRVRNHGSIRAFNIQVDVESIDWGICYPGDIKTDVIHLCANDSVGVTLVMNTSDWVPTTAMDFMIFSWNYTEGTVLSPNIWYPIELRLAISPDIWGIDNFSFYINIWGNDVP